MSEDDIPTKLEEEEDYGVKAENSDLDNEVSESFQQK